MSAYAKYGKAKRFLGFIDNAMVDELLNRGYRLVDIENVGGEIFITFEKH